MRGDRGGDIRAVPLTRPQGVGVIILQLISCFVVVDGIARVRVR